MTTAAQIRKLVRPLLERHGDLSLVSGRMLWLRPVGHVAREVWIDRTGSPSRFRPMWFLTPLFMPDITPAASGGWCYCRMGRSTDPSLRGSGEWSWDDPTMPEDFIRKVEKVLAVFRSLDTLHACRSFAEAHMDHPWGKDFFDHLIYDIAFGNLPLARCWWQRVEVNMHGVVPQHPLHVQYYTRFRSLREPLMDHDRAALAAILHRWERENVTGTKAEAIWTPTPFPIEEMA